MRIKNLFPFFFLKFLKMYLKIVFLHKSLGIKMQGSNVVFLNGRKILLK